ncbi:caspase family protein [Labrys wisconsinensis]|uniref:Caspase-like protein n=1 Tax=Labrys wisconsinensis TaxID=425677 RepID=A0ABU0J509_9HYPH|nr:caspase family protein [Labrys wisconsinensis]MDQ0468720.1 putative caspase-like protein [Labrys wisconsinensis]
MLLRPVLRLVALLVLLAAPSAALAERRVALVIGNSAYRNTVPLPNPRNDAADVARALKTVGFAVIEGYDLDKRGMDDAFRRFAHEAAGADAALFYYGGHGMQFQGSNYLMPVDAKLESEEDVTYEMARVDDVLADLQRASGIRILMLDACRDNPLAQQLQARIGPSRSLGLSRGLARIQETSGTVIAYATQPGAVAADGEGRNSPFASAFLKEVGTPGLEVGSLFRHVARDVHEATGGRQLPEVSLSILGDFYFAGGKGEGGAPVTPAAPTQVAVVAPPASVTLDAAAEAAVAACDKAAASSEDVDRPSGVPGVAFNRIDPLAAVAACRTAVAAAPGERRLLFQLARALDASGNSEEARANREKAAAAGSVSAMTDLALMLETGEGGPRDVGRAVALFDQAAAAGNVVAMRDVAIEFEKGVGRPRDAAQAALWYRKAADTGDPQAMGFLATLYLQGTGVPKDAGQAKVWLDKLLETEHTPTMLRVGYVLLGGTGAVKDFRTARRLFERAADLGDADGEVMLGNMAANGIGGPRDLGEARRRFEKAVALGSVNAKASLMPFLMVGAGGAARDPDKAAAYGLDALRGGSPVARSLLVDKWQGSLTPQMRLAVERHLAAAGLLKRRPDGSYGADTLTALQAWQQGKS